MKHSEVLQLLQQKYPDINQYDVRKVVTMGFPDAQSERSTYILGIRPSHPSQPIATEASSVSLLASPVIQPISNEVTTVSTENTKLKERVLELEMKLQSFRQSLISMPVIQHQVEQLVSSDSIIMHSPDTLVHLEYFIIDSVLAELHRCAPDILQLFETLGKTSRSIHDDVAVEQIKGLVSICTLLNTRTQRTKGLQLLIDIMLISHATS